MNKHLQIRWTDRVRTTARIGLEADASPYRSFWQAGFEGADHINGSGRSLCLNTLTDHIQRADEDFSAANTMGLRTVRESLSWRGIERGAGHDFAHADRLLGYARMRGVQVLWTLCHYGLPDGLDIFDPHFGERLASYCGAFARHLRAQGDDDAARVYTPLNEISFLAWAVCETGLMHPHIGDRKADGYALKKALARATILAIDAIRDEDPDARILLVDPLIHITAECEDDEEPAAAICAHQFQAWDMIAGRLEPSLGGSHAHLDLIGINYYPWNQWLHGSDATLEWPHASAIHGMRDGVVPLLDSHDREPCGRLCEHLHALLLNGMPADSGRGGRYRNPAAGRHPQTRQSRMRATRRRVSAPVPG